MNRNDARSALLGGTPHFRREQLTITGNDGQPIDVEVRATTVAERSEIARQCVYTIPARNGKAEDIGFDGVKQRLLSVIHCTYSRETGERLFEPADYETLMQMPSGCWVDELIEASLRLMNVTAGGQPDVEAAEKNSEATQSDG